MLILPVLRRMQSGQVQHPCQTHIGSSLLGLNLPKVLLVPTRCICSAEDAVGHTVGAVKGLWMGPLVHPSPWHRACLLIACTGVTEARPYRQWAAMRPPGRLQTAGWQLPFSGESAG